MRTRTPRLALAAAVLLAGTALAACGDDDDEGAGASDATTTEAMTTETSEADAASADQEFCDGFTGLDEAFKDAPEDPAEVEAFVAEQVTPNVAAVRDHLPEAVADEAITMVDAVEEYVETQDDELFTAEPFAEAAEVVYGSLDELCDIPVVEVAMVDFGYEGVPETLEAGLTSFVVRNESEAGESHQIELVKVADGVEMTAEEIFGSDEEALEGVIETFGGSTGASAGLGGGTTVELTAGRWVYACLIPVGSVDGHEGTGVAHWEEGMFGEVEVT